MNDNSFAALIDGCLTSLDFKETNYNVDEANAGRPAGNSKKPFAEHPIFAIEKDGRHCYPQNVKLLNYLCAEKIIPAAIRIIERESGESG